jgi:putative membrane protein
MGRKEVMSQTDNDKACYEDQICVSRPPAIMSDDRILLAWQRSHMSNERTFLAWCRTSISLLAFGFVIEKFEVFLNHLLRLEGATTSLEPSAGMIYLSLFVFVLAGVATVFSGLRFLQVRRHINRGEASFSIVPDLLVVISVVAIVIMAALLSVSRSAWMVHL